MEAYTYASLPKFELAHEWRLCKILKVYDGDTLTFSWMLDNQVYKFSGRVLHINTAELRTKCIHERKLAERARDRVRELLLGEVVEVKPEGKDKYGRELIEVKCPDGRLLHDLLIHERLAYPYDGTGKFSEVETDPNQSYCPGTGPENCQLWINLLN